MTSCANLSAIALFVFGLVAIFLVTGALFALVGACVYRLERRYILLNALILAVDVFLMQCMADIYHFPENFFGRIAGEMNSIVMAFCLPPKYFFLPPLQNAGKMFCMPEP